MPTAPSTKLIHTSSSPRILVCGFDDQPEFQEAVKELAGAYQHVRSFREVRQAEWDMLITDSSLVEVSMGGQRHTVADHISVLYVGQDSVERGIRGGYSSVSRELFRVKGLPDGIEILAHEDLEPLMKERDGQHLYFATYATRSGADFASPGAVPARPPVSIEPFIATADNHVLAGRYKRSDTSEAWLLPKDTPNILFWVKAALTEWHALAPDRFPGLPDWSQTARWMTAAEREIHERVGAAQQERADVLKRLADNEAALAAELKTAREDGDQFERALLTQQSDELVAAVIKALEVLGFKVENMDLTAKQGEAREDLRIEDPAAAGWVALGEVKGVTGGAKVEGIMQLMRFSKHYMVENPGKQANAGWYIVNQFLKRDPGSRQPALHGSSAEVDTFAQDNGLVIDTVELFRLLADVADGVLTADQARRDLRAATGIFRRS